jgi:hypothetical protein
VHAARNQDRRLAAALLAAGIAHTPEGEEVLRGARMRAARKPSAVARELLRNFPKSGGRRRRRKRKGASQDGGAPERNGAAAEAGAEPELEELEVPESENGAAPESEEAEADEVESAE